MAMDEKTRILVEEAREGSHSAFEELITQSERMVYNIALRMMGSEQDALDMAQEAYIKAFRGIKRFDGKSNFSTWIYRITVNSCLDELRKRKSHETILLEEASAESLQYGRFSAAEEASPEESYARTEQRERILCAMEKLSLEHKTAIVLRDIEGLSYDEIAAITESSQGTVKSRISRARFKLRELLMCGETGGMVCRESL
ncbi:MAG: sigma-70 family RNA polymerase sigma factor [Firmicutes bacterium]|nr:sigma-70 family RNA polymerase sigma factor [Bacillota bacterium]